MEFVKFTSEREALERIVFRSGDILEIAQKTVDQRDSEYWWKARVGRLTASKFGNVLKSRNIKSGIKTARRYFTCAAVEYGIDNESVALADYTSSTAENVHKSGFYLHVSGALGGSPDGEIRSKSKIVEVKCPYSMRHVPNLAEAIKNHEFKQFYIKYNSVLDEFYLDKHTTQGFSYWQQIQGCINFCPWANSCDLVVWTPGGFLVINIAAEKDWTEVSLTRLLRIWRKKWLPDILEDAVQILVPKVSHAVLIASLCAKIRITTTGQWYKCVIAFFYSARVGKPESSFVCLTGHFTFDR